MKFARITAVFGGVLLAAALASGASAADDGPKDTLLVQNGEASPVGSNAAPIELDKLRARGPANGEEASSRTRESIGPILLIMLLQRNRFSDGLDVLQPVTTR